MAAAIASVENLTTEVWIASRSRGGVSITDMSRMPERPICSVRGIGRRRQRQAVDVGLEVLQPLLGRDAEALLLVDDEQAEVAEHDVLREQAVGADQDVDAAGGEPWRARS